MRSAAGFRLAPSRRSGPYASEGLSSVTAFFIPGISDDAPILEDAYRDLCAHGLSSRWGHSLVLAGS